MGPADPQSCRAEEKTVGMGGRDDGALFRDPHPAGRWYSQAAQGATQWNEDGYLTGKALLFPSLENSCLSSSYLLHLKIHVWVHWTHVPWKFFFLRPENWFISPLIPALCQTFNSIFQKWEGGFHIGEFMRMGMGPMDWNLSIRDPAGVSAATHYGIFLMPQRECLKLEWQFIFLCAISQMFGSNS